MEVIAETEAEFGTNLSGTASYVSIPFVSADCGRDTEQLVNAISKQKKFDRTNNVVGRKMATLSCAMNMDGLGFEAGNETDAVESDDYGRILHTVMGGRFQGAGYQSTALSDSKNLDIGATTFIQPGSIFGLVNPTTGIFETFFVRSDDGSSVTPSRDFGYSPANGQTVYAGGTYYLKQDVTGSLQALVRDSGAENDVWVVSGLQGGFGITMELGQIPQISFNLEGASWYSGSAGAPSRQDYGDKVPPHFSDSAVYLYPTGSVPSEQNSLNITGISMTFNSPSYTNIMGPGGVNNIVDKVINPIDLQNGACTAELGLYYEDQTYQEGLDNKTMYTLEVRIGSQPGRTVAIVVPCMEIVSCPTNDAGGIAGQTVSLVAHHDSVCVPGSDVELAESPFKIARL